MQALLPQAVDHCDFMPIWPTQGYEAFLSALLCADDGPSGSGHLRAALEDAATLAWDARQATGAGQMGANAPSAGTNWELPRMGTVVPINMAAQGQLILTVCPILVVVSTQHTAGSSARTALDTGCTHGQTKTSMVHIPGASVLRSVVSSPARICG